MKEVWELRRIPRAKVKYTYRLRRDWAITKELDVSSTRERDKRTIGRWSELSVTST